MTITKRYHLLKKKETFLSSTIIFQISLILPLFLEQYLTQHGDLHHFIRQLRKNKSNYGIKNTSRMEF